VDLWIRRERQKLAEAAAKGATDPNPGVSRLQSDLPAELREPPAGSAVGDPGEAQPLTRYPSGTGVEVQQGLPGVNEPAPPGPMFRPPGATMPGGTAPARPVPEEVPASAPAEAGPTGWRSKVPTLSQVASTAQSMPLLSPGSQVGNLASGALRTVQRLGQEIPGGPGEFVADVVGMGKAVPEALARALATVRKGPTNYTGRGLLEGSGGTSGLEKGEGFWPGLFTAGTRLNAAGDQFWRTVNEAGGLARANSRGMDKVDPLDAQEIAGRAGDFVTYFGQNSPVAEALTQARKWVDDPAASPDKRALGAFVMATAPYVRTPERVLGAAVSLVSDPLTQPGQLLRAVKEGNREAAREAAGRLLIGTAVDTWLASEFLSGGLNGMPPTDPAERRRLEADGAKWNTLHGVDLSKLGTFGQAARGVATTMREVQLGVKRGDDPLAVAERGVGASLRWALSESYLREVARFASEVREGRGGRATAGLATSLATRPLAAVAGVVNARDPYEREAKSIGDDLALRLPGGRERLPVRRNDIGQPLRRAGTGVERAFGVGGQGAVPEGRQVRRYVGSHGEEEDARIAAAIEKVTRYRNNPDEYVRPTKEEERLYARFRNRKNPVYEKKRAAEVTRERKADVAAAKATARQRAGGLGGYVRSGLEGVGGKINALVAARVGAGAR
jgi:hypothetical protein